MEVGFFYQVGLWISLQPEQAEIAAEIISKQEVCHIHETQPKVFYEALIKIKEQQQTWRREQVDLEPVQVEQTVSLFSRIETLLERCCIRGATYEALAKVEEDQQSWRLKTINLQTSLQHEEAKAAANRKKSLVILLLPCLLKM